MTKLVLATFAATMLGALAMTGPALAAPGMLGAVKAQSGKSAQIEKVVCWRVHRPGQPAHLICR